MSRIMTKPTKCHLHPAKTQISLGIHPVWSESSLCTQWTAKDPNFLHADSRCSGWSESLLGAHAILLVLLWGGSYPLADLFPLSRNKFVPFGCTSQAISQFLTALNFGEKKSGPLEIQQIGPSYLTNWTIFMIQQIGPSHSTNWTILFNKLDHLYNSTSRTISFNKLDHLIQQIGPSYLTNWTILFNKLDHLIQQTGPSYSTNWTILFNKLDHLI